MRVARQLGAAHLRRSALAMGLAVAFIGAGASAQAPNNDKAAVLAANSQLYAAINAMFKGELGPIEAVWSHADDVTYMGPTGAFETGWSAVLKDWQAQAARRLGGNVKTVDVHVFVGRDIAVVADYEQGENANVNGKVQQLKLRATNIFRKENGQWKVIGHHTDKLSYLAK